jgi:hypothetical protein
MMYTKHSISLYRCTCRPRVKRQFFPVPVLQHPRTPRRRSPSRCWGAACDHRAPCLRHRAACKLLLLWEGACPAARPAAPRGRAPRSRWGHASCNPLPKSRALTPRPLHRTQEPQHPSAAAGSPASSRPSPRPHDQPHLPPPPPPPYLAQYEQLPFATEGSAPAGPLAEGVAGAGHGRGAAALGSELGERPEGGAGLLDAFTRDRVGGVGLPCSTRALL